MKRRLASLVHHPMATAITLLLLLLIPASCSKDQPPIAPNHVETGTKSAPSASAPLTSEGVVYLDNLSHLSSVTNDFDLLSTLPMPAVGTYPSSYYCLVKTEDGSSFVDKAMEKDLNSAVGVMGWEANELIQSPMDDLTGGDRDGLTFDDGHSSRTSSDYTNQPAFAQVHLMDARTVSEGYGSVIAILDTGIDAAHPLFQSAHIIHAGNYTTVPPTGGNLDQPASSTDNTDDDGDGYVNDGVGHGTFVAGLLYTGARQATIRVYKVLDDEGLGSTWGLAKAIRAARLAGVHIINCSLGFTDGLGNTMVEHVIADALSQGIVIVASAGNTNSDEPQYPASYPGVISVTAVGPDDIRFPRGSYGSTVAITAPGVDVVSAISSYYGTNKYAATSGSSAAAPWVSAAIAVTRVGRSVSTAVAAGFVIDTKDAVPVQTPQVPGRVNMGAAAGYTPPEP